MEGLRSLDLLLRATFFPCVDTQLPMDDEAHNSKGVF